MTISRRYPQAKTIHLVMDNLNTHTRASVVRHYGELDGGRLWSWFTVHYTPKHGSWLNRAALEICVMNRQCLGRRRFKSIDQLHPEVQQWSRRMNREGRCFAWCFKPNKARETFGYEPLNKTRSKD